MTSIIDSPVHESPSATRRERKRATDRKSQRNHRERQRAYIKDLERTVAALNSASTGDERLAALLAENEAFRKKCGALLSQLTRIRTIASETDPQPSTQISDTAHQITTTEHQYAICADDGMRLLEAPGDELLPDTSNEHEQNPDRNEDIGTFMDNDLVLQVADCLDLPDALQLLDSGPLLEPTAPLAAHPFCEESALLAPCPSLPRFSRPQGSADKTLQAMIEEARSEHEAGRFDTSTPSLKRLLSNAPADILSFRLFHYINSYGPMPMHWMLATFWVQYLYLRWHVLQTAEAHAAVPYFMRPTALEYTIPHRICISMLVWPDVRQALIRDALTVDPEPICISLLQSLPTDWASPHGINGDMLCTMDVHHMIEVQSVQFDFWKVGPTFVQMYPQYRHCDLN
ncbi:hypothetical protein M011DRAFT_481294 [Sporormia fimetaria CBS 119925]|uniref:BZIP domain-containing protein n=1 Tax=Sporormia fimetaria CBS 119925 TaxID=1340428 RepID=A0A6A6UZC4_9PLEO|nr:hypothetical protein M011DRAFT_481294 [Sporormia fimetaria CBS 119925]